ncbi:uncharacterized protein B0H18DRAFT_991980 [Fomitopsis serialis]|uniref:uncharacterized protein n=1 Tax=Fomitopsis serialis TaxID=139415 RepID=UPI002007BF6D|nr:uncharacterized protein B0H18DRAFT_991980 [Neoantrodia serialis]KAH9930947.1 hypothetical protein B0H18DRAFT_991980 [Neoantrodia serialis]
MCLPSTHHSPPHLSSSKPLSVLRRDVLQILDDLSARYIVRRDLRPANTVPPRQTRENALDTSACTSGTPSTLPGRSVKPRKWKTEAFASTCVLLNWWTPSGKPVRYFMCESFWSLQRLYLPLSSNQ